MGPALHVRLLGAFSVALGAESVEGLHSARLQSLIAFLALNRDVTHLRQSLAFLFWPDSSEAQARNNLRQLLYALRHTAPALESQLLVDNRVVCWMPQTPFHLDVSEF